MGPWHLTEANRHMRWKSRAWSLSQMLFFISKKRLWILNVKIIIKLSNVASVFSKGIKRGPSRAKCLLVTFLSRIGGRRELHKKLSQREQGSRQQVMPEGPEFFTAHKM